MHLCYNYLSLFIYWIKRNQADVHSSKSGSGQHWRKWTTKKSKSSSFSGRAPRICPRPRKASSLCRPSHCDPLPTSTCQQPTHVSIASTCPCTHPKVFWRRKSCRRSRPKRSDSFEQSWLGPGSLWFWRPPFIPRKTNNYTLFWLNSGQSETKQKFKIKMQTKTVNFKFHTKYICQRTVDLKLINLCVNINITLLRYSDFEISEEKKQSNLNCGNQQKS